ncbi:MAG: DegT/DnrJ/EryC1/StrS family aminotransferase [Lentisphaerae bacterium]|nr:DegT/DnrJ/EryC1/StrS family aminotransferase [Lentisphaerota bacterium]
MYRVGKPEIDAIASVIRSGNLFRYQKTESACARFERRYAAYLDARHVLLTSSGTTALTAALVALDIGPGDEVMVPACTYMATACAVLAAGAIPVIVDVDESITMDPAALDDAVGPRTRAVIPVHMWGLPCNMNAIMRVARRRKLLVIEDACQAVGGGYHGRKLGTIGDAGAFSFNYYKNMTCGEGGAVVTRRARAAARAACMIDCCGFYWKGRQQSVHPFTSNGSRASELEGAMLNVQLDRIDAIVRGLRRHKHRVLNATAKTGLQPIPLHSPADECGAQVVYLLPTRAQADAFARQVAGTVVGKTGRHIYTEWDPIFRREGAHHPALNPYRLPQNRGCRMTYRKNMCPRSLDILHRAVMIAMHPDRKAADVDDLIAKIRAAASLAGVR